MEHATTRDSSQPIRVLHAVASLNCGGIEKWLLEVVRRTDRSRFQIDFLVHSDGPHDFENELTSLGCEILVCKNPHYPLAYMRNFCTLLTSQKQYDVFHSHLLFFSGFTLLLAWWSGIPARIAHSHNDLRPIEARQSKSVMRTAKKQLLRFGLHRFATHWIAASTDAADYLYGRQSRHDPRTQIIHCGIDLEPFFASPDKEALKQTLGIPTNSIVIGHVGTMITQKNHALILAIAREIREIMGNAYHFVLVGDGPLRSEIEAEIEKHDLSNIVHLLGTRSDVPALMCGCFDLFLFPSHYEGLGLVAIEAQASGLPCLLADSIPNEAEVVPELITRAKISDDAKQWVDQAIAVCKTPPTLPKQDAHALIRAAAFDIESSVNALEKLYTNACTEIRPHA